MVTPITTSEAGCASRTHRVGAELLPSATVSVVSDTAHPGGVVVGHVTATPATFTLSYSSALLEASTAWVMEAASFTASASWAARTVTVCAVLQLLVVKVRVAGDTVTSELPVLVTLITTSEVGCVSSFTV